MTDFLQDFKVGEQIRIVRVPQWSGMPADSAALFQRCIGQVLRIDGITEHGYLELNVMDDGSQSPDYCQHTIWIEPECVEAFK